jgi:hypothetical protein
MHNIDTEVWFVPGTGAVWRPASGGSGAIARSLQNLRRSRIGKNRGLGLAQSLHARGRLAEALDRELLQRQRDQVEALEELGVLTFHLGHSDGARAFFARGLAIQLGAATVGRHGTLTVDRPGHRGDRHGRFYPPRWEYHID